MRTAWDGEVIGTVPVGYANVWKTTTVDMRIPDGVNALYFTFVGQGYWQFKSFTLL